MERLTKVMICPDKTKIYDISNKLCIHKIGKTLFLTKSEAEAKLKELRGNQNGKV